MMLAQGMKRKQGWVAGMTMGMGINTGLGMFSDRNKSPKIAELVGLTPQVKDKNDVVRTSLSSHHINMDHCLVPIPSLKIRTLNRYTIIASNPGSYPSNPINHHYPYPTLTTQEIRAYELVKMFRNGAERFKSGDFPLFPEGTTLPWLMALRIVMSTCLRNFTLSISEHLYLLIFVCLSLLKLK